MIILKLENCTHLILITHKLREVACEAPKKKKNFFQGGAYFRGNIQLFDYKPPPSFEDTVC